MEYRVLVLYSTRSPTDMQGLNQAPKFASAFIHTLILTLSSPTATPFNAVISFDSPCTGPNPLFNGNLLVPTNPSCVPYRVYQTLMNNLRDMHTSSVTTVFSYPSTLTSHHCLHSVVTSKTIPSVLLTGCSSPGLPSHSLCL